MEKFRVLSDLHLDVNQRYPICLDDKDIFTVICGDTSGYPDMTSKWIKENCPNGVGVSGNHLPYNDLQLPIQELRKNLSNEFPASGSFTYLDCETETFSKVVDGILFIGTCMYTDMHICHKVWNPDGNEELNKKCSAWHMNDYSWGIKSKDDKIIRISPDDYAEWFKNAYRKIDKLIRENEKLDNPKDVVLITHHPILPTYFGHNGYVEDDYIYRQRDFNWPSYASDMTKFLKRHFSIKCYCCGHIHDVYKDYRHFYIEHADKSKCLVVNNARGYVVRSHDTYFNKNLFVNTSTWEVEDTPIGSEDLEMRKKISDEALAKISMFI